MTPVPPTLLAGRVRTTTVAMAVLFLGVLALYLAVRPPPVLPVRSGDSPPAVVVPLPSRPAEPSREPSGRPSPAPVASVAPSPSAEPPAAPSTAPSAGPTAEPSPSPAGSQAPAPSPTQALPSPALSAPGQDPTPAAP
jgi:hypothetical protein